MFAFGLAATVMSLYTAQNVLAKSAGSWGHGPTHNYTLEVRMYAVFDPDGLAEYMLLDGYRFLLARPE